jgi:PleD family two-component response regulator
MKIACLDDSTAQLGVYKVLFRSHDVKLYSDPDAFLLELEEFLPDLIILDLIMPYMCGTEVCERIKQKILELFSLQDLRVRNIIY